MSDHPITPPPQLVKRLRSEAPFGISDTGVTRERHLIAAAYRAGADAELEACCEEMKSIPSPLGIPFGKMASNALRTARRPSTPPETIELDGYTYRLVK